MSILLLILYVFLQTTRFLSSHNLTLRGWNSHVHRGFPGKFESSNVSRDNVSTVSFHNFKSQNFKLSVSNPKSKYVAYLTVLSWMSNCQSLGRNNKHEILQTDRTNSCSIKSPRVTLSGRPPINFYGHENSHPWELRVCLSQTLRNPNS